MSASANARALEATQEHLRAALAALSEVSVAQHLLPGVKVDSPSWHYERSGVSVYVVLDRRHWDAQEWRDKGWIYNPSTGEAWHAVSVGRKVISKIPEERVVRTDEQMLAEVETGLRSLLATLAATRVEDALEGLVASVMRGGR